jgi:hypothetical protein
MVARLLINIFWASCVGTIQTCPKREPEICRNFVEAAILPRLRELAIQLSPMEKALCHSPAQIQTLSKMEKRVVKVRGWIFYEEENKGWNIVARTFQ